MTDNAWSRAVSPTFPIGTWVHRVERRHDDQYPGGWADIPTTLSHLVETVINDNPTTRCGRAFLPIPGTALRYEVDTESACFRCKR